MVLRQALVQKGAIGGVALWIIFAFWGGLTIGILVLMEGLSAFLHTLRLHWYVSCYKLIYSFDNNFMYKIRFFTLTGLSSKVNSTPVWAMLSSRSHLTSS